MKKVIYILTLLVSVPLFSGQALSQDYDQYKEDTKACNERYEELLEICDESFSDMVASYEMCTDSAECIVSVCLEDAAKDADFPDDIIENAEETSDNACDDEEEEGPSD